MSCNNFKLDKKQKAFLKHEAFHGNEIVANTRRLCLMNMFLHNIGEIEGGAPISPNDSLVADAGKRFDYVLANPPFGKKSSMSFTNEEGEQQKDDLTYNRQDFCMARKATRSRSLSQELFRPRVVRDPAHARQETYTGAGRSRIWS